MFCINLCELNWMHTHNEELPELETFVRSVCREAGSVACERLYIGSSFCPSALLQASTPHALDMLNRFSDTYCVPITLTLPIASECERVTVQNRIFDTLKRCPAIDEVTVNDYGILSWISQTTDKRMNLGRLFSRELRDIRYEDGFPAVYQPTMLTGAFQELQRTYTQLAGIEFDPAGLTIDVSCAPIPSTIALHVPYLYVTTGRFCPFAPSPNNVLPANSGSPCSQECCREMTTYRLYEHNEPTTDYEPDAIYYTHHGKTVYILNPHAHAFGAPMRIVYTPRHFGWIAQDDSQHIPLERSWQ